MSWACVYNVFQRLPIDSYESFLNSICRQYASLYKNDYKINNVSKLLSFSSIDASNLKDRFSISYNDITFECLLNDYNNNQKKLFVIFSGARKLTDVYPSFKRWSYYPFIGTRVLSIADPMFIEHKQLTLGWYYGNKEISFIKLMSDVIKRVLEILEIKECDVTFFGSSGGGYVALQVAQYFDESTHIALNPQIYLSKYHYAKEFSLITGIDLNCHDIYCRNDTSNIILSKKNNKFLIVQNIRAKQDCILHLFPFCTEFGFCDLELGLNLKKNILIWLYNVCGGHNAQGDQTIFSLILYLATKIKDNTKTILDSDRVLFKIFSLLWEQRDRYFAQRKLALDGLKALNVQVSSLHSECCASPYD